MQKKKTDWNEVYDRVLEQFAAVQCIEETIAQKIGQGSVTISTGGKRKKRDLELCGLSRTLIMTWTYTLELALKCVIWECGDKKTDPSRIHDLSKLFDELKECPGHKAEIAVENATWIWNQFQDDDKVSLGYRGTLTEFFEHHARDWENRRYFIEPSKVAESSNAWKCAILSVLSCSAWFEGDYWGKFKELRLSPHNPVNTA